MGKAKRRPVWLVILGGILYMSFLLLCLGIGTVAGWLHPSRVGSAIVKEYISNKKPEEVFNKRELFILVLGCDEDRAYGGKKILKESARSDMMLVAKIDFTHKRVTGLSIPRDLLVSLPGYSPRKINAYHAIGGKELAKRAAESVMSVSIDRVIEINYKAFQEMVDMVGGVDIFVNKRLKYTDRRGGLFIDLKPGLQKLNGYNAMCFVRYRHGDSDFARQDRQHDFILAFKDSVKKNLAVLPQLGDKALDVMGGGLMPEEVASLVRFSQAVGNDNIEIDQVPTLPASNYNLVLDRPSLIEKLRKVRFVDTESTTYNYYPAQ